MLVAPLVGAWIEINKKAQKLKKTLVAPLVGAWIEIGSRCKESKKLIWSLLSWERGLKFNEYLSK